MKLPGKVAPLEVKRAEEDRKGGKENEKKRKYNTSF